MKTTNLIVTKSNAARCCRLIVATALLFTASCVFRIDVQQGNKLEDKNIEAVEIGMTRNQVRFLLGTPVTADPFHSDRWDYIYYFRQGRSENPERRWLIVWFDGDQVREIQRDVVAQPG